MKSIRVFRIGLPVVIMIAGVVVAVSGSDQISVAFGVVLIGIGLLVALINWFIRLSFDSQDDRDREEDARERFRSQAEYRPVSEPSDPHRHQNHPPQAGHASAACHQRPPRRGAHIRNREGNL